MDVSAGDIAGQTLREDSRYHGSGPERKWGLSPLFG
jgi:hypothetical protein